MTTYEDQFQRAMSVASAGRPKIVYIKTRDFVYELNAPAVKKWAKDFYSETSLEAGRAGKKIFRTYQGGWTKYPVTETFPKNIELQSKEGEIIHYLSIPIHGKGSREIATFIEQKQHPLTNDMSHYKALLAESKKTKLPESYATDLTNHDKRELSHRLPHLSFGWILRKGGTSIVFPEAKVDSKYGSRPSVWTKIEEGTFGKDYDSLFYTWDGKHLAKRTPSAWGEWMDRQQRVLWGELNE